MNPEEVIGELNIKEDTNVADFGCGSGGFTFPAAKKAKRGKIYAIDFSKEALSALKGKMEREKAQNIRTILADIEEGLELKEGIVDLVIMSNIFFQSDNREIILKEAYRVLCKGGEALVVDWKRGDIVGVKEKVLPEEVKSIASKIGFETEKEFDIKPYHYAVILKKA